MEISLKNREWKEFKIQDIFELDKGKYLPKKDIIKGNIPYISAKSFNNGLNGFIGNSELFESNCITIEKINLSAYYQKHKFYCSHDVTVIRNSSLNEFNGLFICNMINRQSSKYSYGRQAQLHVIKSETVFLPIDSANLPDYSFMEEYIKSKIQKKTNDYNSHISKRINKLKKTKNVVSLKDKEWSEFHIEDLFKIKIGKNINANNVNKENGKFPYITRKESNNGLDGFIDFEQDHLNENFPVITIGNETAEPFVQNYHFFTGTKVNILSPKIRTSRYSLMFISLSLKMHKNKYSYSFTVNSTRLKKQKILLPINEEKEPDYTFMENYMKRLELNKLRSYLKKKI